MPVGLDDAGQSVELDQLRHPKVMSEEEETERGPGLSDDLLEDDYLAGPAGGKQHDAGLDRRTRRKLDFILLPFLALLFLLNSLDKSNVGNAETAGFTHDTGLEPKDLNTSMAYFFAVFVALQPVGAAFGRKVGMRRWVPGCMTLWGLCTLLHMWIRKRWQLILLRVAIASLEAGFYPTAVSYLSLFYTRYEFAVRLGIFYGQTAVAGVLGSILSWAVFSKFESPNPAIPPPTTSQASGDQVWRSWEVLFAIEGCTTVVVALVGFFWLPHSADTAWFLSEEERQWAEQRIRLDQLTATSSSVTERAADVPSTSSDDLHDRDQDRDEEDTGGEAHHRLLNDSKSAHRRMSTMTGHSVTEDSGLSRHDVLSAIFNYKIWHLLVVNILSAIPATAFGVFLPLVVKQLSPSLNLSPSASNLLAAPPFACGAVTLFIFTRWSDRIKRRLKPILWGLGLLLFGLTATVLIPTNYYGLRYVALCILLSGSFIASPLTVAWLTNNTPEVGKRAILLGINGWGNLSGVFLALLFTPADRKNGYVHSYVSTLLCVFASFAGYILFWAFLARENRSRAKSIEGWSEEQREREELLGDVDAPHSGLERILRNTGLHGVALRLGFDDVRRGDEKLTFRYTL